MRVHSSILSIDSTGNWSEDGPQRAYIPDLKDEVLRAIG